MAAMHYFQGPHTRQSPVSNSGLFSIKSFVFLPSVPKQDNYEEVKSTWHQNINNLT